MDVWRARMAVLFPLADLVKISAEDLGLLARASAAEALAADLTGAGVRLVVVTDGGEAATGWTSGGLHATATPPRVKVVDTVGAGDTFQAALLARLLRDAGGPKAALAGLDAAGLAATPRLCRAGRGDHLLAARRRPAARRRADRLKDTPRWSQPSFPSQPFDLVIFGATGDLAHRKILPSLFRRLAVHQMPAGSRVIGAARSKMSKAEFRKTAREALDRVRRAEAPEAASWSRSS